MLQLVHNTVGTEAGTATEPNLLRSAVIGYVIGFSVVALGITVAGTLAGLGFVNSLGLGAFVGFWGGGGFGFMMGFTLPLSRRLDAQSSYSTRSRATRPTTDEESPTALQLGHIARKFTAAHLGSGTTGRPR